MNYEKILKQLEEIFDEKSFLGTIRNKNSENTLKNPQNRGRTLMCEKSISAEILFGDFVKLYVRPEVEAYAISQIYNHAEKNLQVYTIENLYKLPKLDFAFICLINSEDENYISKKLKKTDLIMLPEKIMFSSFDFLNDECGGFSIGKNAVPIKALIFHREAIEIVIEQFFKISEPIVSLDDVGRFFYRIMYEVFVKEEFKDLIYAVI